MLDAESQFVHLGGVVPIAQLVLSIANVSLPEFDTFPFSIGTGRSVGIEFEVKGAGDFDGVSELVFGTDIDQEFIGVGGKAGERLDADALRQEQRECILSGSVDVDGRIGRVAGRGERHCGKGAQRLEPNAAIPPANLRS